MLKVHNPLDVNDVIPFQIADEKRYVIHSYDGYDSLIFEFNSNDAICKYIAEEVKVEDETNRFVVKHIDEHSNFVTVTCDLDLDDWKQEIYYEFRTTNKTLLDVMQMITPQGWRIVGAEMFTKRTTVEGGEGSPLMTATPLEVLVAASEAYSCVFNFDVINRIISAIDPTSYKASGEFFTDEINLKSLGFVGMSDGFATRLYAYGKKDENGVPMTFADINDGKPYVEDYSYSTKIVCIGWSDERYTNPASLLADAKARLKQVSHPSRSYECDARNLKNDVWLYKVVTLIDRKRGTRVDHQVVEYREYPNHSLDVITLSKSVPNIKSYVAQVQGNFNDSLSQESSSMHELVKDSIEHATQQITGNRGGHFAWIFDADGKPVELLNLCDSDDLNTAKSVWRWNASGLGHSKTGYNGEMTVALLPDGSINASAILAGILNAAIIQAGILKSLDGKTFYLDLEKGILNMQASSFSVSGKTVEEIAQDKVNDAFDKQTSEDIFNKLTNNGAVQGFYVKDGKIYINAELVKILNLVAESLISKDNFGGGLEILGGVLRLYQDENALIEMTTEYDGYPIVRMTMLDEGKATTRLEMSPEGSQVIDMIGDIPSVKFALKLDADGDPAITCQDTSGNVTTKKISWKSNGDGTFTMIGVDQL